MADMILILVEEIFMTLFAICAVLGNGFILYIILSRRSLRRNESLFLIIALASVDFIFAISLFPYLILLLSGWGFTVNYPPLAMVLLNMPVATAIKISQIIDCAIGIDRLTAIQWPVAYKLRNRFTYAAASLVVGVLWAAFDVSFILATNEVKPNPLCAAAGCFLSSSYLAYSGFSNVFINAIALLVTALVLVKIYTLKTTQINPNDNSNNTEYSMFRRANNAAVGVLLCSSITILVPGCIQGIAKVFGFAVIQELGPFVALGLTLKTATNPFIYGFRHQDIRQAIRKFRNRNISSIAFVAKVRPTQ